MAKFFRFAFASTGTKTPVPDTVPADGSVSYPTGWGVDYERNPVTDPAAKLIPRADFNQVMFDVTDAIRELQVQGSPGFIAAADNGGTSFAYQLGAIVRYANKNWVSQIANNTQTPAQGAAWRELNAIVASDYAASQTETNAGTVVDKYVTPGVLQGGVRATLLTGLLTTSAAAVAATDTVLAALGKLQRRTADLDASRVKTVNAGTNISVDNTDPLNPVINAPGSDVPNAPVKTAPIVWGDLAVITDSQDANTLKRATFLNIRNVLQAYFNSAYSTAAAPLRNVVDDADFISGVDREGTQLFRTTWANLKSRMSDALQPIFQTAFDGRYLRLIGGSLTGNLFTSGNIETKAVFGTTSYWSSVVKVVLSGRSGGASSGDYQAFFDFFERPGDAAGGRIAVVGFEGRKNFEFRSDGSIAFPSIARFGGTIVYENGDLSGSDWNNLGGSANARISIGNRINTRYTEAVNQIDPKILTWMRGRREGNEGTYAFCRSTYNRVTWGQQVPGSSLRPAGVSPTPALQDQGFTLSGTWVCLGYSEVPGGQAAGVTLYYKIAD